jgi:hypothetical protein
MAIPFASRAVLEKLGLEQEILGRIAAQHELGKRDDLRAAPLRLGRHAADGADVAVEVPNDRIDLGEGDSDLHGADTITGTAPGKALTKTRSGRGPATDRAP